MDELKDERKQLETTLGSEQRLKTLVKKELIADAEEYGDERMSPLKEAEEAKAIDVNNLIPTEQVTIVLSEKGWVRAAKGHDVDPLTLNYKSGDAFKQSCYAKSNQLAVFVDSGGRFYSLPAHTLPSARSLGEPVSARLTPPDGVTFEGVMSGDSERAYLVGSDAGYGFMVKLEDVYTKNRNGKAIISVPKGAKAIAPSPIYDLQSDWVAIVSNIGRLLMFPITELTLLPKGKGLKMMQIPPAKLKSREEYVVAMTAMKETDSLLVYSGKRYTTLKTADHEHYIGERGRRGNMLPKGF